MTVFIWESYPAGTNGKLSVHGCLVAPLNDKWNPNVTQDFFWKKGEKNLPDVSQFVYPQKTLFKFWQNVIFNWQVKLPFGIFIFCNQDEEDQAGILV